MIKARRKSDGKIIEVTETPYQDLGGRYFDCPEHKCYYREDKLDFLPEKETAVMEGWVARDENENLHLFMDVEPRRLTDEGRWWDRDYVSRELPQFSFPSVTWLTEPKNVSITLEAIEE